MTSPPQGNLSYAQLKAVWLDASKGTRYHTNVWASLMAAIAEAESQGDALATNPNDNNGKQTSWGLWQISNGTHSQPSPNWADPIVNARLAIAKLNDPNQGLTAWGTYTSGAYKAFLSNKTAPDYTLTNAPSHVQQAQVTASAQTNAACAWGIGWGGIPGTSWLSGLFGGGGNVGSGEVCIFSKSQARAVIGVGLLGGGLLVTLVGVQWIVAAAAAAELSRIAGPVLSAVVPEAAAAKMAAATAGAGPAAAPAPTTTTTATQQPRNVVQGRVVERRDERRAITA